MRIFPLLLALLPTALVADDVPLASDVTAVTLYPRGATVTREVPFELPPGRHRLILADLPKGTPLASVRVAVTGAVMGGVTSRDDYVPPRDEDESAALAAARAEVERLEAALRQGRAGVEAIRLEREAATARVEFLSALGSSEAVARMDVAALRELTGMIGTETLAALQAAHDAGRRAEAAERGLEDLREELKTARQALQALVPEDEARATLAITVTAPEAADGTLTVTYNTPRAGWQPVYDLRLRRDSGRLAIDRGAFLRQGTGENWSDIALTLSTVRPAEQTAPSPIRPWLRRIYDPEERRPKTLMRRETDAEGLAGALAEPTAEAPAAPVQAAAAFDGLAVTYSYPGTVSVASGADRLRVALGSLETQADLVAQAVPLSDTSAFLMAAITNDTDELILPTSEAMFYLDGRFVGRQGLDLVPAGGEARLAFGPIDGLRLTRTVLGREEGDRGVITRSNALDEQVRIEVENLTGESWPLRVLDRVPYSEQEDLEITWSARPRTSERDVDGKRNVLAWEFELPAGETQVIGVTHTLNWPEGMKLR